MMEWKLGQLFMIAYTYNLIPWDLSPSLLMGQVSDIFTTFCNHLRQPSSIKNIVYCFTLTLFSGYSISLLFFFSENEKVKVPWE